MTDAGHVLHTARLKLRPVQIGDAGAIAAALGDWDVTRWLSRAPYPYGLSDAEEFISANTANAGRVWMIEDATGMCGCMGRKGEFGYWLSRAAWGRGYATEAGRALLAFHFAPCDAPDLLSGYHRGNTRSARVLSKLGFTPCEDRTIVSRATGAEVQIKGMHLTRADYMARPTP